MADDPNTGPSILNALRDKISALLGASSETVQKIKFGRGAVGKIAVIAVAGFAAIVALAHGLGAGVAYLALGVVALIVITSLGLILYILSKRPEMAVMEGSELVMYQHVQLAAKGVSLPPPGNPVPPPGTEGIIHTTGGPKGPDEERKPQ